MKKTVLVSSILAALFAGCANEERIEQIGAPRNPYSYEEDFNGASTAPQVRSEGSAFVAACAEEARKAIPAKVKSSEPLLCRARMIEALQARAKSTLWAKEPVTCLKKEKANDSQQGYEIRLGQDGRLKISIDLYFTSVENESRRRQMLAEVQNCIPLVQEVWARYGVDFSMGMSDGTVSTIMDYVAMPPQYNAFGIVLDDRDCRSNAGRYCMQSHRTGLAASYAKDALCSMVIHETGHLLGLIDEYYDEHVPNRPWVSNEKRPWSMMGDTWHRIAVLDFYPRHLAAIFEPVCPETAKPLR